MINIALPGSPGAGICQDYYGDYYRKENSLTYNDVVEIQTPKL
jgi:hypothetical protein